MKKILLLMLVIISFRCESHHDKLLKQLDKEELQRSLFLDTIMKHRDSLIHDSNLATDTAFANSGFRIETELKLKDMSISALKERILLEK